MATGVAGTGVVRSLNATRGGRIILRMIERLYVHNFRCLENFELVLGSRPSTLLIGRNGAGKSTVAFALEILQRIGRGTTRVDDLVKPKDLTRGRAAVPMRFEVEARLDAKAYKYTVAFDFPSGFKELRVFHEQLLVDGATVFSRELAEVRLMRAGRAQEVSFRIDWNNVALPIVQSPGSATDDPISVFRQSLATMLILRPIPSRARGDSELGTTQPDAEVENLGEWFTGLFAHVPEAYEGMSDFLKDIMPDLQGVRNISVGGNHKRLTAQFKVKDSSLSIPFEELSDGEKCFVICALVVAANEASTPSLCFWDEPDNFVGTSEIGNMILALRQSFRTRGQLIVTSHNTEAVSRFSEENTLVLYRNSHLEPAIVRSVEEIRSSGGFTGSFIAALVRGDVIRS